IARLQLHRCCQIGDRRRDPLRVDFRLRARAQGIGVVRLQGNHLVVLLDCPLEVVLGEISSAKVVEGFDFVETELDRLLIVANGGVIVTPVVGRFTKGVVVGCEFRVEHNRLVGVLDGVVVITFAAINKAAIGVGRCVVRIQLDGFGVLVDCAVVVAVAVVVVSASVVAAGVFSGIFRISYSRFDVGGSLRSKRNYLQKMV